MHRLIVLGFIGVFFAVGCNSGGKELKKSPNEESEEGVLRIVASDDPHTLDPRLARDLTDVTYLHLLFEGIARVDERGIVSPALASHIEISEDLKTYTIQLRESYWSDGERVTAEDFAETWKSLLSPLFPAPNAYQLYAIKGAKAAKEGLLSLDAIGVTVISESILKIDLENPVPYFLDLLASHFYYPVPKKLRDLSLNAPLPSPFISNGPFTLQNRKPHNELTFVKNVRYWDASDVSLQKVVIVIADESTALRLFETNEVDWVGSPLSTLPQDAVQSLRDEGLLQISQGAGTHWFRFNIEKFPFTNEKLRTAFHLALDRKSIVEHVTQGSQLPAHGILPPGLYLKPQGYFEDSQAAALSLFEEALSELQITKESIGPVTLYYSTSDRNHKIAQTVQQQWQKAFGIPIRLQNFEAKVLYDKLKRHDYQMSIGSWFADYPDPLNFLEVFKYKNNGTNNTGWEKPEYIRLLDLSEIEKSPLKRRELLLQAEQILMTSIPVSPLFFSAFNFAKKKNVTGVYFSGLGYLDFKHAVVSDRDENVL